MRAIFALSLCAAMSALSMSAAMADPIGDLTQMRDSFLALHSFHAEMTTHNGSVITIDTIRPDKIRATSNGPGAIEIGPAGWVRIAGQWRAFPAAANMVRKQTAKLGSAAFKDRTIASYTITDAGSAVVRGIATHKYHLASKTDDETINVFVANHLPVRIVQSNPGCARFSAVPRRSSIIERAPCGIDSDGKREDGRAQCENASPQQSKDGSLARRDREAPLVSAAIDRLTGAAKAANVALTAFYQALQEIDRKDHRLMVTLRARYSFPQLLSALADAQAELAEATAAYVREKGDA